jgi:AAA+ superfamily predicted ATPase
MSKLDPLRQAAEISPDNIPLLLMLADGCVAEWELEEARSLYERVLRLEPGKPAGLLGVARTLHLGGKSSEAVVRVEALLASQPNLAGAHLLRAQVLLAEGNRPEALLAYEKARMLDPSIHDPAMDQEQAEPGSSIKPGEVSSNEEDHRFAQPQTHHFRSEDEDDDEPFDIRHPEATAAGDVEQPKLRFADVGGMDALKEEISMKIIYPLRHPELYQAYGKKAGGGVLLYGPPGCGKTLISRATAGEIASNFMAVGIHDILDMYIGNSERKLHQLFETARANAPVVIFFDEVDALAADRNDLRKSAGRTLVNQFLAEMDSGSGNNDGILILGATNAPWHLDSAFRRPGRFDRILFVPPPDEAARRSIITVMAQERPTKELDFAALAKKTKEFSGADLKAMFDLAVERSLARAMKEGRIIPLTTDDLLKAAKEVKPSTKPWFESARNHALYANQGGFYDEVLRYLGIEKKG